jgi:hypothetical protein
MTYQHPLALFDYLVSAGGGDDPLSRLMELLRPLCSTIQILAAALVAKGTIIAGFVPATITSIPKLPPPSGMIRYVASAWRCAFAMLANMACATLI